MDHIQLEHGIDARIHDLDHAFHQGLVPGTIRLCRKGCHGVMFAKILEGFVQRWLIFIGFCDRRFKIIRHDGHRNPAKIVQGTLAGADKVFFLLRHGCFHVGQLARPKNGQKDLYIHDLTGLGVNKIQLLSRIIHVNLIAGLVVNVHDRINLIDPASVMLTKLRKPKGIAVCFLIFLPQYPPGHPPAFQLFINRREKSMQLIQPLGWLLWTLPDKMLLQFAVAEFAQFIPRNVQRSENQQVLLNSVARNASLFTDGFFPFLLKVKPQYMSYLTHSYRFVCHGIQC